MNPRLDLEGTIPIFFLINHLCTTLAAFQSGCAPQALLRVKDQNILRQIMDDDEDEMVRQAAKQRLTELGSDKVSVDV